MSRWVRSSSITLGFCVGTGRIACATETQRQRRRAEASGTKCKNPDPTDRKLRLNSEAIYASAMIVANLEKLPDSTEWVTLYDPRWRDRKGARLW
jgi:hypothetical protein